METQRLKRHLLDCKTKLSVDKYLIELHAAVSIEDYFDEYKNLMLQGQVDKQDFLRACYRELTVQQCVRELILCNSTDEMFRDFVRFSTGIFEPQTYEFARSQYTVGGGGHKYYEFLESLISTVSLERTVNKFSDVFNDARFESVIKKYLQWARVKNPKCEIFPPSESFAGESQSLIKREQMIRQGLAIAENRFFLFEPKARAVQSERRKVTRVDITDRQESESRASSPVDQQEQIISQSNKRNRGAEVEEYESKHERKQTLTRKPPSESSKTVFKQYIIGFQAAFKLGNNPDVLYSAVNQLYTLHSVLSELGVSSEHDVEYLSDDHLHQIASCLKEIPKRRFLSEFFNFE